MMIATFGQSFFQLLVDCLPRYCRNTCVIFSLYLASAGAVAGPENWLAHGEAFLLSEGQNTALFIGLLLFLPLVGVPLSLFCLVAGSKFGLAGGLSLIAVSMLWHLTTCYWLMQSVLKDRLWAIMSRRQGKLPHISHENQLIYSLGLMIVPILPYMVKNLVVAAGRFRFLSYLSITWPIQVLLSFPFVAVTSAVHSNNLHLVWVGALGFVAMGLLGRRFYRRHRRALH